MRWQYGYLQCFKLANNTHIINKQDTVIEDVCLWTRYCDDGCNSGNVGQTFPVAYISEIVILNNESRIEKNAHFFNCFNQIQVQLNNLIGQDAVNEFIHGPDGQSRLNFKYKVKDENYVFSINNPPIHVPRGYFRFKQFVNR